MTMFSHDDRDIDKKLQEIEDEDVKDYMQEHGYSDEEIETAVRSSHLAEEIRRLEEILCEREEIFNILTEEGWKREDIENVMKYSM